MQEGGKSNCPSCLASRARVHIGIGRWRVVGEKRPERLFDSYKCFEKYCYVIVQLENLVGKRDKWFTETKQMKKKSRELQTLGGKKCKRNEM